MDREAKRKGAPGASPDTEGRAAKRQKLPNNLDHGMETPETTSEMGMRFMESIKQARDKTGRPIATPFLTLPGKDEVPGYYDEIKLPMALDIIEAKIERKEYPTLAALEGDLKRMVANAKSFNEKNSAIFGDVERVRKTASNWMVKFNPAYKEPGYTAVATPIPGESLNGTPAAPSTSQKLRITNVPRAPPVETPAPVRPKRPSTREKEPEVDRIVDKYGLDLVGKTFQEAQIEVMQTLIDYTEDDIQIYQPFLQYPPRALKDYYQLIKTPVSLTGILKKAQGTFSKQHHDGISAFKSWDQFEEEVSLIWRNARDYNIDGSDIYNLANEFEQMFKEIIPVARKLVPEPTLKIKLSAGSKPPPTPSLKLNFRAKASPGAGSQTSTPAARSSATPGVIVDSGALARQQRHVESSINGNRRTSHSTRSPSDPAASVPPTNGIKNEVQHAASPRAMTNGSDNPKAGSSTPHLGSMPPPAHVTPGPSSGSPHPHPNPNNNVPIHQQYHAPPASTENISRVSGNEVVLPNIQLSSNPALRLNSIWKLDVPAHPKITQQSKTCTLPASQHFLQIIPTIPVANTSRPWRLFVHVNGIKTSQAIRSNDHPHKKDNPPFDVKLAPGVNRIDVEVLAASEAKKGKAEEVLRETCTIFVNLLRH